MKRTPRRVTDDVSGMKLSRLESFVLDRVNGELSVKDLVHLTGLAAPQVEQIILRLESRGAIELSEAASEPQLDELLADEKLPELEEVVDEIPGAIPSAPTSWVADKLPPPPRSPDEPIEIAALGSDEALELVDPLEQLAELSQGWEDAPDALPGPLDELEEIGPALDPLVDKQLAKMPSRPDEEEAKPSLVPAEGDATDPEAAQAAEVQNYRKLFETELRPLPLSERIDLARRDSGANLMALCFDQDVEVIKAILENDRLNLDHARLIAAHHRNPVGLEALTRRTSILKDARVQRMLLRNVQLTESLMKRLLNPKRLLEVYKTSIDRDIADRTRGAAKTLFKNKFSVATPEEKFEVIWNTEGRVLPALLGQTIDQKTTALFCARPFTSVMLIQAFCRFPATPPGILAHILKQPLVMRQPHLRNMALVHPNVPSDVKRKA
jgi:hypothetical protein